MTSLNFKWKASTSRLIEPPAFVPMFQTGSSFNEALMGKLIITNSTPEAVKNMLQYIYSGKVDWPTDTKQLSHYRRQC